MTRNEAIKILDNIPKDIYTLDGKEPDRIECKEIWNSNQLHKKFMYKGNNQNVNIDCIVDYGKGTFNLVHAIHNPKQELPFIFSKIGERLIAYLSVFGLKRDFYL